MTDVLPFSAETIDQAARLIRSGGIVAVPTETVYGLAADATNAQAVARIYEAKGRPAFNPLIVHVPDWASARSIGDFSDQAADLAQRYWPGPLTLVVPLRTDAPIASITTAGLPSVGLRVPEHRVMRALLRAVDRPLAAPSANASGTISPTRADHVLKSLGGKIPLIIDDGPSQRGIESTIVAATGGPLRLLRPGPVDLGLELTRGGGVEAPGQLESHYAPSKPVRLDANDRRDDEHLIGFGPIGGDSTLSATGDLIEAAARLFDLLHAADASEKASIAVAPVPMRGLGIAISDRLRRAAAGREIDSSQ